MPWATTGQQLHLATGQHLYPVTQYITSGLISGFASNWRRLRQVVRERVIRGACRPLGAYSLSINALNTKRPSFDLLTSGVRSGIRRRKLPGEPMKNGDSTRRLDDGGRQTGSSGRDGGNPVAQPAVHQRHGSCSSNPNSPGIFGASL